MIEILQHKLGPLFSVAASEPTKWQLYVLLLIAISITSVVHVSDTR